MRNTHASNLRGAAMALTVISPIKSRDMRIDMEAAADWIDRAQLSITARALRNFLAGGFVGASVALFAAMALGVNG